MTLPQSSYGYWLVHFNNSSAKHIKQILDIFEKKIHFQSKISVWYVYNHKRNIDTLNVSVALT